MPIDSPPGRFLLAVAVFAICLRDDRVLLLRRAGSGYHDGELSLPAGHLDGGESAVAGVLRELAEEVGLDADPQDCRLVLTAHHAAETAGGHEYVDLYFVIERWRGEPRINEPDKCTELRWADLGALPTDLVDGVRAALDGWRDGRTLLLHGWPERERP